MAQQSNIEPSLAARVEASVALLRQASQTYRRVVYASSLGAEAVVLTELICREVPAIDIVSVDTGRLPEETLALLARLEQRYGRRMPLYYPDPAALERLVREQGINGFYDGLEQRLRCCQIRKLEPFGRAVAGYSAWITGVRREQSGLRAAAQPIARDSQHGLDKVSPLLDWTWEEIWSYIRTLQLDYNPLHNRGYTSIGCAPCSRALEPGEEHRAGRWWWEQADARECGLHPRERSSVVS